MKLWMKLAALAASIATSILFSGCASIVSKFFVLPLFCDLTPLFCRRTKKVYLTSIIEKVHARFPRQTDGADISAD